MAKKNKIVWIVRGYDKNTEKLVEQFELKNSPLMDAFKPSSGNCFKLNTRDLKAAEILVEHTLGTLDVVYYLECESRA